MPDYYGNMGCEVFERKKINIIVFYTVLICQKVQKSKFDEIKSLESDDYPSFGI